MIADSPQSKEGFIVGDEEEAVELSVSEVRRTIAAALAAAFAFVIALLWKEVVLGGLATAGIDLAGGTDIAGWAVGAVTAVVMTIVMVIFIVVISRWGGSKQK
jgi:hypothetical protein